MSLSKIYNAGSLSPCFCIGRIRIQILGKYSLQEGGLGALVKHGVLQHLASAQLYRDASGMHDSAWMLGASVATAVALTNPDEPRSALISPEQSSFFLGLSLWNLQRPDLGPMACPVPWMV